MQMTVISMSPEHSGHFNSRFDTFYCWLQLVWSR